MSESLASEIDQGETLRVCSELGGSPEQKALDKLFSAEVWGAVKELSDDQQIALILRFRHDLSYEEIALIMGSPSGTVRSWVHHALRKLRDKLSPAKCEVDNGL
jgi:RNA polymerase sigma-70 factor (ECF subfamily)